MRTVAVIGASLAGLSAARGLRAAGFDGRLVLVGEEKHAPYDRPPLSKEFLAGKMDLDGIALAVPTDDELDLEWRLGVRAERLDPAAGVVHLSGDESFHTDGVVIATGARVRTLPGETLEGVHELRTLDDALKLREVLVPGAKLVIVGAGFIGAEIASTARDLGVDVTLVELAPTALAAPLGDEMGEICSSFHAAHGVDLHAGVGVDRLEGTDGHVHTVHLADGRSLPADLVVVGIGTVPNTEWLEGSGLNGVDGDLRGGVLTDAGGATNLPNVVATGDVAAVLDPFAGHVVRHEHWTNAMRHPALAAATLLGAEPPRVTPTNKVPYFWSDQYGIRLQFAGHRNPGDTVEVVEGDPAQRSFLAVYKRDGEPVAVLSADQPRAFTQWRRQLGARA